jgi:hypothetical protein
MGFNKRIVDKELVIKTKEENLGQLFRADALIFMDGWASKFHELYQKGLSKQDIIKKIENEQRR